MTTPWPKKRILVIEDESDVRSSLQRYIALSGYDVSGVASGEEGLKQIAVMIPDLVLLDISLPESDGLTILQRLHEKHEALKVVMLAGESDIPKAQWALNYGAGDYVTKPVDLPNLKRILQLHLASD